MLPTAVKGAFYRLYLMMAIDSRKVVAWEVYLEERVELAAELLYKACLAEGTTAAGLVLHANKGSTRSKPLS